jgi:O-acetyl-ADP-ribose deacetylase (regulator of RNase III)
MGSGIAPQIKDKFPEAFEVDCATIKGDKVKLGTISFCKLEKLIIVNLYGQFGTRGRQKGEIDLDYNALTSALKLTKDKFSGKRFGFPMLGSGLAGGDWNVIEKIIQDVFAGEYVTIVRYVP